MVGGGSDQQITVSVPVSAGRHTVKLQMPNIVGGNYDIILKPQTADATLDVHSVKVCRSRISTPFLSPMKRRKMFLPLPWELGLMV